MRFFLFFAAFLLTYSSAQSQMDDPELDKVRLSWQLISTFYVDSVDTHEMAEEAIKGMLEKLDPHSVYIPAEEVEAMNEPLDGNFEGIGIEFMILKDTLMVVATISGGPSEKVGLMAGDRIVVIDGENVAGIGLANSDVFDMLRGPKGSEVRVKVLRDSQLLEFTIERDKIPIFSIEATYLMSRKTGYIKISRFAQSTHREFIKALRELKGKGIDNLVLDLRGNGGGYLKAALDIADEFIDGERLLLYTDGMAIPRSEYHSRTGQLWEKGNLVILIDEGSASASEIVAGAVQDWDRGVIMGRRSFGKGLVQRPFSLPDGAEIRLTIAKYYTPSGRSIQKSYDEGLADYHGEIFERFQHGEMMHSDSIDMPDSLTYNTLRTERKVFGGGGIMPDIFIPMDTAYYTPYYRDLVASGSVNRLVMDKLDVNRDEWLTEYASYADFNKRFVVPGEYIEQLTRRAEDAGVEMNEEQLEISLDWLKLQMKALIARNLWSTSEYYQTLNPGLPFFETVIKVIEDQATYQKVFGYDN
ncbi:S41 family peptidase [Marinilabilia sp.]|uniref:S41 family peptidase n=1 Tax=Marinilabilia sp. TaxID=2021252 RepID=UPI0025C3EE51|nr:S41 family peptidase [Marinilabilia sp.]